MPASPKITRRELSGLVEPLQHAIVEDLHIKAVDAGVLQGLLGECLCRNPDWSSLDRSKIIHMIKNLYATAVEDRARWRAMPLHRGVDGERGSFDDSAQRAFGDMRLPSELESEIRLLDPDGEVSNLYLDVPALDEDGALRAMLMSRDPYRFAYDIVRALCANEDGHVNLPRNSELRDILRESSWLPHRGGASGFAPRQMLLIPSELQSCIAPLASAGAIGEQKLPDDVVSSEWNTAETVVQEILGRTTRARQIQRLASALNPAKVASVNDGAYLILPEAQRVKSSLIEDALQSPLAGAHPGWAIVRTAERILRQRADQTLPDAVLEIARGLCAPMPASRQVSILMIVGETHPSKDSPSGRFFRSLLESFAETAGFFDAVLPFIELPTQDGQWQPTRAVARSASGVARRHRALSDLRSILRIDADTAVPPEANTEVRIDGDSTHVLEAYFKPWADRLPSGAVGAFIGLLGNGKDGSLIHLAENWLGADVSVEGMRRELVSTAGRDPSGIKVFVSGRVANGQRVEAVNLLGARVEMEASSEDDTIFATDPVRRSSQLGDFWEIGLRAVDAKQRTAHELVAQLGGAVEWWAVRVLRLDLHGVRTWWSRWGTGSQAQIGPVQASILAHLPLTLHQLDVSGCEALREALREAQRAQRRSEQAPPAQVSEAKEIERAALKKLASLIRDNRDHQHFLWSRIQDLMRRYGYREDSVLLELAQNADDALAQASEIANTSLPPSTRGLLVRVHLQNGATIIDVRHYGRPINDTGGAAFPAGRDRQWDQDLYFMMLLNLSGKPGEIPGHSAVAATTGRFGLGFKSVHLVSASPSVASGFIAFSIAGGLLPIEQPTPDDPDLLPADGHQATRVRLPLMKGADEQEVLARIFRRFAYARTLLPVFARQLTEVVVDGGPFSGVSAFDPQPLDTAAGWSLAATTAEISGQVRWRVLRFRPADAGGDAGTGTAALAVGLKDGSPESFPVDLPFLWNVTPTSEGWGCGYAVNGPFKLDPGRSHVSLDDDATRRVAEMLGKALGGGLVKLHDFLLSGPDTALVGLPAKGDVPDFLAKLWEVLVSGIDTPDELRRKFLRLLHGPDSGLSVWMKARAVVPSYLPPPFAKYLPALKSGVRVEVAGDGLDNPHLCRAFSEIADIALLAARHAVVSSRVAERLQPLLNHAIPKLDASDLLAELADGWGHILTPERLHTLRPLAGDDIWKAIPSGDWHVKLVVRKRYAAATG
ncbi:hypothetical protein [uncultured Rhodoblastus sp.]|uniref:hypothetical protein n=1 Tax=uncultured Rhodoblastus sp. TaxID=543037 RepID=UPI0025D7CDE4|nr:hypothetical protein [uncultured Rhodoblastus sp.]